MGTVVFSATVPKAYKKLTEKEKFACRSGITLGFISGHSYLYILKQHLQTL